LKALEKNPNNRYQTAAEFARALRRSSLMVEAEGVAASGSIAAPGVVVDDQVTVVMSSQPKIMPLPTRAPAIGESRGFGQLVINSEEEQPRVIDLKQDFYTIGRHSDQDIVLTSNKVSRHHARLERGLSGNYRLTDTGSRNGSWIGSYRLINN